MTNGVVNRGRWLVAAFFAIEGGAIAWSAVTGVVNGVGRSPRGESASFYPVYMDVLWSVATLVCAWGIYNWQAWARHLALFLSALDLVGAAAGIFVMGWSGTSVILTLAILLVGLVYVWLLLPSVRAEYARKSLTA